MVVGCDVDGVLTCEAVRPLLSMLSKALLANGHSFVIITLRNVGGRAALEQELRQWDVHCTDVCMATTEEHLEFGGALRWKSAMAELHGVSAMLEDDPEVLAHMPDSVTGVLIVSDS